MCVCVCVCVFRVIGPKFIRFRVEGVGVEGLGPKFRV